MDISKRVFGSNVDQKVQNHIKKLQGEVLQQSPNESVQGNIDYSYIGNRTPYARMWTAVNVASVIRVTDSDNKKKWEPVEKGTNSFYIVNDNRDDGYIASSELDSVSVDTSPNQTYTTQGKNPFLKPPAGIKSLNSKSEGSLGALRRTSVEFVVHNKKDFEEIYLPFFLKPGSTIFVDFGWSENNMSLYDPEKKYEELGQDVKLKEFFKQVVQKDQTTIEGGLSNTIAGQVTKYDVNVDQNGSFNCTLEMVSGNYRLLDKTVTDDNDLKFVFDNSIEELILTYLAVGDEKLGVSYSDLIGYRDNTNLSSEERKKMVMDTLDEITATPNNPGIITKNSKRAGIFYQDSTRKGNDSSERTNKEAIYISFGFFEDKFLNSFISEWITYDDKGKAIIRDLSEFDFSPSFSNRNAFVRWDKDLFEMQKTNYLADDNLISFLYPDTWDDGETYNSIATVKKTPTLSAEGGVWFDSQDDRLKRRIPLRELFISVPTISEAFRTSSNVNDALEFIFDRIYDDSGSIINIKMISTNDAQSSISFHDANMDMDAFNDKNILEFDLTSGNSLIQSFDLKFETPKAGLSSMIAIGNLETPEVFDTEELMKFHALNAVQGSLKKQIKHLPRFDDRPKRRGALTLRLSQLYMSAKVDSPPSISTEKDGLDYAGYKKKYQDAEKKRAEDSEGTVVDASTKEEDLLVENDNGDPIVYAKSNRDFYLLSSKIANFYKSEQRSIAPVLPITLSLKSYGNNFLSYGDFFTVNYLPQYYKDRVVFQIVGVDHTIDTSGWSTNYTTVMRLKSQQKYRQSVDDISDYPGVEIRYHGKLQQIKLDEITLSLPPESQNSNLKYIIDNVKPGYRNSIGVQEVLNQSQKGDLEFSNMRIEESILTIDYQKNLEKVPKHPNVTDEEVARFPMVANTNTDISNSGATSYWGNISSLILGDELIDWKKVAEDYSVPFPNDARDYNPYLKLWKPDRVQLTAQQGNNPSVSAANNIYVIPAKDSSESFISDKIFDTFDRFVLWWYENSKISEDNQEKIFETVFHQALLRNHKRSASLKFKDVGQNSTYNQSGQNGNFQLFKSIFWYIPQDVPSEWSVFKISGHSDYKVMTHISLPRKYVKKENLDSVFKKFYNRYFVIKNQYANLFKNTLFDDSSDGDGYDATI
mgnify:FL=1